MWNRMKASKTLWMAVACAFAAAAACHEFLFAARVPAPVDQVHQFAPWFGEKPSYRWDILQMDGALQFLPWRDYMLEAWRSGEVPFWNPYTFLGTPFLANSQSAVLYPLHLIWALTPFSAEGLVRFSAFFHVFWAGLGVTVLIRAFGGSHWGALVGALSFQLGAFILGWLELPSVLMTASWIPWTLAGVLVVWDRGWRALPWLLSFPMMFLAGHLQIAAFGSMAAFLLLAWLLIVEEERKRVVAPVVGLVLCGLVALPQLLPTLDAGLSGHRSGGATEEGWTFYQSQSLSLKHLSVLLAPSAFGLPQARVWDDPTITSYWLAIEEPGRHYAELAFYVGPVVPALALLGLFGALRRRIGYAYLLALFGVSVALGTAVAKALYFWVPGWSSTGSPGRAAVLVALGLCVAAGCATRERLERVPLWFWITSGLGLVFAGVASLRVAPSLGELIPAAEAQANWSRVSLVLTLLTVALLWFARDSRRSRFASGLASSAAALFLLGLHNGLNPTAPAGLYKEDNFLLSRLKGHSVAVVNDSWSLLQPAQGVIAPPNSLLPYRIATADGYDSIILKITKQRLDEVNRGDSAPAANGNMLFVKPPVWEEGLERLCVDYVLSDQPTDMPVAYEEDGVYVYKVGTGNNYPVVKATATTLVLDEDHPKAIVFKSYLPPGWTPVGDGEYVYEPRGFRLGLLLAFVGIVGVFGISLRHRAQQS